MKLILGRYRLRNLYGLFCGYNFLIADLKSLKAVTSFNLVGTISQTLGLKKDRPSVPLYALLTQETENGRSSHQRCSM